MHFQLASLRALFLSTLLCAAAGAPAHAWVDDFDGDTLHEDWEITLLSAGTGYSGGVSGGSLTVDPHGGSGWRGVGFERPYVAEGDFEFSTDWSWSTGGYAHIVIGLIGVDGTELHTVFSDSHTGCSGESFSARLYGERAEVGSQPCSGSGTTSIRRSGDTVTISYAGSAGSASLSAEFTEPIAAVQLRISEWSGGSVNVSIDRVEINCGHDPDGDGDGHASLECNGDDCDDDNPAAYPGADEVCDEVDNDCDDVIDEDDAIDAPTWYGDADGDGFGDVLVTYVSCTPPSGHVEESTDCDDADAAIFPDADETCDEQDNDCDGTIDEDDAVDAPTWYADIDGDGFGDPGSPTPSCSMPTSHVSDDTDCDDLRDTSFPGADETCDGTDNDCDGITDEDDAVDVSTWYADTDSDGYGDPDSATLSCSMPSGHVSDGTDCDDTEAPTFPGAVETCDGADNDCDGTIDEDDAVDTSIWYADADGDGFGDPSSATISCGPPEGHVSDDNDCDDTEPTTFPGADETCDEVDNNCDGTTDEDESVDATTWHIDHDGDGYGSDDYTWVSCEAPPGFILDGSDCDDLVATTHPDSDEFCDEIDNDCDEAIDEDAIDMARFFADTDGDGFGDAESTVWACSVPEGHVEDDTDCDDDDPTSWPGAPGWTTDCDPIPDEPGDTGDTGDTGDDPDTGDLEDTGPLDTNPRLTMTQMRTPAKTRSIPTSPIAAAALPRVAAGGHSDGWH